jgi:hypothetical protein
VDSDNILGENYVAITKKELDKEKGLILKLGLFIPTVNLNENGSFIRYGLSKDFGSVLLESKNDIPQLRFTLTEI